MRANKVNPPPAHSPAVPCYQTVKGRNGRSCPFRKSHPALDSSTEVALRGEMREFHAVDLASQVDLGEQHRHAPAHLLQHAQRPLGTLALNDIARVAADFLLKIPTTKFGSRQSWLLRAAAHVPTAGGEAGAGVSKDVAVE